MITNLVCEVLVTLVTNVTEVDNHRGCSTWQGIADHHWALYHLWHEGCGPYVEATERTNVCKVVRVTDVRFEMGGLWVCRKEEVIGEERREYRMEKGWVPK